MWVLVVVLVLVLVRGVLGTILGGVLSTVLGGVLGTILSGVLSTVLGGVLSTVLGSVLSTVLGSVLSTILGSILGTILGSVLCSVLIIIRSIVIVVPVATVPVLAEPAVPVLAVPVLTGYLKNTVEKGTCIRRVVPKETHIHRATIRSWISRAFIIEQAVSQIGSQRRAELVLTTTSLPRRWTSMESPWAGMAIALVNAGRRTRTVERAEVNFMIYCLMDLVLLCVMKAS